MGFDLNVVAGVDGETGDVGSGSSGCGLGPVVGVSYAVAHGVAGDGLLAGWSLP